ncbi:MAG: peptide chain release factor 2, partial [Atopobiaceae bacterium]
MAEGTSADLDALGERLASVERYLHVDETRERIARLEAQGAAPG